MSVYHPDLTAGRFIPRMKMRPGTIRFMQRATMKPPPTPDDMIIEDVEVPGLDDNPPTSLRIYRPASATGTTPALFWIHGGGYILGSPIQDEKRSIETARRLGITVASVSYRLAPTHTAPAAINDAFAGLTWLVEHAQERGVDPQRIAIGGASAGGGLAACLVHRAHDRGIPIRFQLLVYPMLDDRTTLRTDMDTRDARLWTAQNNQVGWASYLGVEPGSATVPPYSVELCREDLTGLPPAWVGVGTVDIFHDEDLVYAKRLGDSGVPCELFVVPGAFHGFDALFGTKPVARDFLSEQLRALAGGLGL